jgi:hypothetical protein
MHSTSRIIRLVLGLIALCPFWENAQDSYGWRISPERINIRVGEDRRLQLLDELAQELHDAAWYIDDSALAELRDPTGVIGVLIAESNSPALGQRAGPNTH